MPTCSSLFQPLLLVASYNIVLLKFLLTGENVSNCFLSGVMTSIVSYPQGSSPNFASNIMRNLMN